MSDANRVDASRPSIRSGFTLIELLVVMAVIAILVALILPAVQQAREAARRSQCKSQLKQIGIALHNYHEVHNILPPGFIGVDLATGGHNINGRNSFGWGIMILPMLDQDPLYKEFNTRTTALLDPANAQPLKAILPVFHCPSDAADDSWDMNDTSGAFLVTLPTSNYVGNFGTQDLAACEATPAAQCIGDGIMYHNSSTRLRDITDGQTTTFMLGERRSGEPGDFNSTWAGAPANGDESMARVLGVADHTPNHESGHLEDFSSQHSGGCHMMASDGSVHFVNDSMDEGVWKGLSTRRGEELIGDF